MAKYYEREDIKRELNAQYATQHIDRGTYIDILANLKPTKDVAEVVRCRDCKHYEADGLFGGAWCDGKRVTEDWYCADGERREHED